MPKDHALNVLLDQATLAKLRWLAEQESVTMATIVRRSILSEYNMKAEGVPLCADNQRCYVPQMHAKGPQPS